MAQTVFLYPASNALLVPVFDEKANTETIVNFESVSAKGFFLVAQNQSEAFYFSQLQSAYGDLRWEGSDWTVEFGLRVIDRGNSKPILLVKEIPVTTPKNIALALKKYAWNSKIKKMPTSPEVTTHAMERFGRLLLSGSIERALKDRSRKLRNEGRPADEIKFQLSLMRTGLDTGLSACAKAFPDLANVVSQERDTLVKTKLY